MIDGLSLALEAGTSVGLVGTNGAGKTTLVEALAGLIPSSGEVYLGGQPVKLASPRRALESGIALCPSHRGIFYKMTVEENLLVGGYTLGRAALRERVQQQLDLFPGLAARRNLKAGQLSGGESQQLAIARALMVRPRILLLDEPSRGLSPAAIESVLAVIGDLVKTGVAVLIADQAVDWLHERVARLLILANGRLIGDSADTDKPFKDIASRYFDLK
ncbi:MAG TPA: ATP-binding cassette domain-containing protein [Thermoanaerobaculia bacterium]|nr:ATP-binding cassette domain-containing protein [Thermoanaerobaculia bacterium]